MKIKTTYIVRDAHIMNAIRRNVMNKEIAMGVGQLGVTGRNFRQHYGTYFHEIAGTFGVFSKDRGPSSNQRK